MVRQSVLRECLRDDSVEAVLAIGRNSTGYAHPKLRDFVIKDMFDTRIADKDQNQDSL